jgi:hypothetical protein
VRILYKEEAAASRNKRRCTKYFSRKLNSKTSKEQQFPKMNDKVRHNPLVFILSDRKSSFFHYNDHQ